MDNMDKEWARKYILDPLTAPEPSQETGPGTSHYNQYRAAHEARTATEAKSPSSDRPTSMNATSSSSKTPVMDDKQEKYPSPPSSASPSRQFHPSNPFASSQKTPSNSDSKELLTPPVSPPPYSSATKGHHRRSHSVSISAAQATSSKTTGAPSHNRNRSVDERFPGDMSNRPLDFIKRESRAAERQHRHRKRISETDMIDSLDTIGGTYHHGGPYDATLISRNLNKKYSPVAALRDSNMETLRATPREYIIDSLERHLPLQGTATIPPGGYDLSGNKMEYEEGPDLMRESGAWGGGWRRWDNVPYHPDDLKGKGEPSFTIERALKEKKRASKGGDPMEFEMQSGIHSRHARSKDKGKGKHQRSISTALTEPAASSGNDLQRRNSTGKKLSDGLKRRWGSIRRKADPIQEGQ